jgi:D-sedoheptulose 7-phosphate isomerase
MNLQNFKTCLYDINEADLQSLKGIIDKYEKIIILGNGGSNGISCHIAQDYTKMLGKRALCFGDSSRLTCYANDYGWENAYVKFIEHFADEDTLIILISSSGNSQNILNCAKYSLENNLSIVTLSGFYSDNQLKKQYKDKSLVHFYVNSTDYGIVECLHEVILHSVI